MKMPNREALLQRLIESRSDIEELLPRIDPALEIFPGWTILQMLAHITGWDDASIDSLRAHVAGRVPDTPANRGINEYNARTVSSRQDLDYSHILKEWHLTRQTLLTIIKQMPEDKLIEPLILPWGGKGTVLNLIDIFIDHEREHAQDIKKWLEQPDKPLGKKE